jgi:poly-gamma-glutamate capsule biosynthesis protein CapA/YwtB (metallophosphatase superfamily)
VKRARPVLLLLAATWLLGACGSAPPSGTPAFAVGASPSSSAAAASPPASAPPLVAGSPAPTPGYSPVPGPSAHPGSIGGVAIVPVTSFRSPLTSTSLVELQSVLAGTSARYQAVELVSTEADGILAALGVARPADPTRLVLAASSAALTSDMAVNRKRLGFLRADAVTPAVRALGWAGKALFGVGRVAKLGDWPLKASLGAAAGLHRYDPAAAWTLVAGGDILLDRGVAQTVKIRGKGVDFPFAGGTADITSRYCCSSFGWNLPRVVRTGNAGALRSLLRGADLAIANFENPAPNRFSYHTHGTVFSADPRLIDGLRNAGIDYVSLANNHIRDAGGQGILDTIANLDKRGIDHSGAGRNLAAARRPAMLAAGGVKVAILGYDTIAKSYAASATRAGSAQLSAAVVKADVAAARKAGANLVIVFPHWGTEYDPTPFAGQQKLARACIDAGADLVIGNHAHWAGAVETYKGKPIWYALGNFVFDQTWSEPTMEGITLELTFRGATLVQARMRPHIILDKAQPNFLDPAGDGRVVMGQIFDASKGMLDW